MNTRRSILVAGFVLLFAATSFMPPVIHHGAARGLRQGVVRIPGEKGKTKRIRVEIAETVETRARGLMFRRHLAFGRGMLLRWRSPQRVAIWMKNTFIPLDIIFIDSKERIVRIRRNARPLSLTTMPSGKPVIAVLELPAGSVQRLRLRKGMRLELP